MKRTERHIVTKNNKDFKQIDHLCFLSKNLYNYCNYILRQNYFDNQKLDKKDRKYIDEYELSTKLTKENQIDFRSLPISVSQQAIKLLFKNWRSFWKLTKTKNLNGKPKIPGFKDKIKGRNLIVFTYNCSHIKDNHLYFQKKNCNLNPIKTNVKKENFQQVRIIPNSSCYVIEIVYNKKQEDKELNKDNFLSIDLGINNLAACITNLDDKNPLLVNGKVIKSFNQFYNKKKAKLMSFIGDRGISNKIKRLELKRYCKISDYLHKSSRFIINYCISNKINNIVIGKNDGWKNNINLGKINNQKFVSIPFNKFISMINYKAEEIGINVIIKEEAYTSKCDSLALESIEKQENYKGERIKRGLFQSSISKLINADVNGSINILRKVIGDNFVKNLADRGFAFNPIRIKNFNKGEVLN